MWWKKPKLELEAVVKEEKNPDLCEHMWRLGFTGPQSNIHHLHCMSCDIWKVEEGEPIKRRPSRGDKTMGSII